MNLQPANQSLINSSIQTQIKLPKTHENKQSVAVKNAATHKQTTSNTTAMERPRTHTKPHNPSQQMSKQAQILWRKPGNTTKKVPTNHEANIRLPLRTYQEI